MVGCMDTAGVAPHELSRIRPAVEEGRRGGLRLVACCGCGWRGRPTLTRRLAEQDWVAHATVTVRAAA